MGFFDETIRTFEVYNQPLFAYPNTGDMSDAILYGVLKNEDIATHMQRAMMTNLNMGHIRRFNRRIADMTYPYGYPTVKTNFRFKITPELQRIIDEEYGNPMDVSSTVVGSLTDEDWILSELGKNNVQAEFTYISTSSNRCPVENEIEYTYDFIGRTGTIDRAYFSGGVAKVSTTLDIGTDDNTQEITITFDTDIGQKPSGEQFITIWCSYCDGGLSGEFHVWVYNTDENLYQEIGEFPKFYFGSDVGYAECFPDIPLRVKNVNYDDDNSTLDADAIERQLRIFGVDAKLLVNEVMDSDEIDGNNDKMDNIFSSFGVRIWDESEAGRQYLYTFFAELHSYVLQTESGDALADCIEVKGQTGDQESQESVVAERECHSITVTTDFSERRFFFSGIKNEYFTKAQVDANPELSNIYYSDRSFFDSSGNLVKNYHSSSGELLRPAGYTAMGVNDVEAWIAGNGTKSHRKIIEGDTGWNWLKPAVRILHYDGVVYDSDGYVIVVDELIPENIYEIYSDGIRIIRPLVSEGVTAITYYAITENGMDSFTVFGAGGQVFVEDTETSESRLVKLTLRDTNKLVVPMMFGLLENNYDVGQMHDKVDSLIASMHMSVYVADVTIVKYPWWAIVAQVIILVITIVLIYTGQSGTWFAFAEGMLTAAVMAGIALYAIAAGIFKVLGEISPWISVVVSVIAIAYGYYNAGGFAALGQMSLAQILQGVMKVIETAVKVVGLLEAESQEDSFGLLEDKHKKEMNELTKLIDVSESSTIAVNALYGDGGELVITPTDPSSYFDRLDSFHDIGDSMFDVGSAYDYLHSENAMLPGVA